MHGILLVNTMMGAAVLLVLWPFIPIFFSTGVEPPANLSSVDVNVFLLINASFTVSYYLLYTFGMTATSPLYISMTSLVGMPMAAFADWILKSKQFSYITLLGTSTHTHTAPHHTTPQYNATQHAQYNTHHSATRHARTIQQQQTHSAVHAPLPYPPSRLHFG